MPANARNLTTIALTCVMAVLLCLVETASAVAAKSPEKTASGIFFADPNIYTGEIAPESQQPQWEIDPAATPTASGRQVWLSADPIGEEGGINLYQYCYGNPLNLYDPDGRHPVLIIPIVIGLFATTENAHAPANAEDQNVGPLGIALAAQAMFPPGAGCVKNGIRGLNAAKAAKALNLWVPVPNGADLTGFWDG